MNKTTTLVLAAIAGFGLSAQARTTTNELWTVNFEGVETSQETGIAKLADLDASAMEEAFTDGAWTVQSDDDSYVTNVVGATGPNRLELDTQGNDLTWTPTDTGLQGNRSITEMDVRFVAADDAPDGFDATTVQTAFFVQNIYTNEFGETQDDPQSLQLYAWTYDTDGETNHWEAIGAPFAASFADSMHHVQILIDYRDATYPYLHVAVDGTEVTGEGVVAANAGDTLTTGKMTAVSFKGTGTIDNFTGTRLYTDYAAYDFTAEVYMDGEYVAADSQVKHAYAGDYDDPTHKAVFDNLPTDDAPDPTYSLARVVIVDLSTGNETTYAYTYDEENWAIVPVSTACPVLDVDDGGIATLSPYTYGATNDSVIAKLYYNTLDAYFAGADVNVGEDSARYEKFVKPADAGTTVSWTFPNTTNGTYVLRSVVVANGATFDSSTGVVSFEVPEGGIGSDKTYATVTYVEGGYDAEALEWVYDAGTGTYTLQRKTFTVTWVNGEDTVVTNGVAYGDVPEYYGETPTKASTAQYDYAFAGWTPAVIAATSNATYNAAFDATVNQYVITWTDHEGTVKEETLDYGATPTAPSVDPRPYTEAGAGYEGVWPVPETVTGTATYAAVYTESTPPVATVITITDNGATTNVVGTYGSLADAIHAADDGDTVVLLADETADATKTTRADRLVVTKQITIDFGPYTYSVPGSLEPTDNWCALYIDADTTVKGTTGGIDCLDKSDPNDLPGVYAFNVREGATLTIEGGVYHGGGTVIQTQLGSTVINGGTFSVTPFDAPYGYDFALNCVDSAYGADTAGFEINGGTFVGFDPQDIAAEGEHTDFTDDGYVAIDDGNGNFVVQAGYNVTFDANGGSPTPAAQRVAAGGTATAPAAPAKAGCTFAGWKLNNAAYDFATVLSADIELVAAYDAAKATVISIADGTQTYYDSLQAAVNAAAAGDTVQLLDDAAATRVTVEKNLVIDLGGHTYTGRLSMFDGNVVVTNGTVAGRFDVYDSSVVTLAANTTVDGYVIVWGDGVYGEAGCKTPTFNLYGTVRNNDPETTDEYAISTSSGDDSRPVVNIYEGAVVETIWAGVGIRNGASLNMTGGSITAGEYGIYNNGSDTTPTTINVSGGTVTSTNEVDTACGIYQAGPGALTLSGTAVVSGPDAVEVRAGTVQVLDNARLVATMPYTEPASNGNGNSGHGGVALLVSQHTTAQNVSASVSGGTLQGPVAFEEATVETNADPTKVSGEISGGTILGDVLSEDIDDLIPSDSEALFADADAEGVEEGYGLKEDPTHPGLYVVAKTHVVTYANYDGTALQVTTNFVNDATPAYAGATPAKSSDSQYDYTFIGWSPAVAATVTEDATYVAQFSAKENGTVIVITDNGATTNYFATLQAALDDVKENNLQQANIELLADASITISRNGNVLGGNSTTNITINGNNHELHVVRDGTWAQFNTANDATLVLNDMSLTSEFTGTQTGWVGDTLQNPNHNIAFNCDVELNDVTSTTALSFWKDADLDTVTIAETVDVYSIWIHTTAGNVAIKDLVVDSPNGRGIKVDDSFVKYVGTPSASTAISIDGASFTTKNRKAAVLVRSAYPIDITTAGTIDISNVPADTQHLVWVDEAAAKDFGLVTLDGGQSDLGVEGGTTSYAASFSENGTWIDGYYTTLADAVEIADADDTVTLLKDNAETFTVSKALTITRNGFSAANVTAGEGWQRTDTAAAYVFAEESQEEGHIGAKSEEGFYILAPADDDYDETQPLTFEAPDLANGTVGISASMVCPDGVDEVTLTLLYKTDLTASTYSRAQVTVTDIDPVAGTATVELPSGLGDTVFFFGFSNEAGVVDTTSEP